MISKPVIHKASIADYQADQVLPYAITSQGESLTYDHPNYNPDTFYGLDRAAYTPELENHDIHWTRDIEETDYSISFVTPLGHSTKHGFFLIHLPFNGIHIHSRLLAAIAYIDSDGARDKIHLDQSEAVCDAIFSQLPNDGHFFDHLEALKNENGQSFTLWPNGYKNRTRKNKSLSCIETNTVLSDDDKIWFRLHRNQKMELFDTVYRSNFSLQLPLDNGLDQDLVMDFDITIDPGSKGRGGVKVADVHYANDWVDKALDDGHEIPQGLKHDLNLFVKHPDIGHHFSPPVIDQNQVKNIHILCNKGDFNQYIKTLSAMFHFFGIAQNETGNGTLIPYKTGDVRIPSVDTIGASADNRYELLERSIFQANCDNIHCDVTPSHNLPVYAFTNILGQSEDVLDLAALRKLVHYMTIMCADLFYGVSYSFQHDLRKDQNDRHCRISSYTPHSNILSVINIDLGQQDYSAISIINVTKSLKRSLLESNVLTAAEKEEACALMDKIMGTLAAIKQNTG